MLLIEAMFLLIAAATLSFADTWRGRELEQKWRTATVKFGPLRVQLALVLSNAGMDSNVYYSPTEPIKDFTLTGGPAVNAYLPLGRKIIFSGYASPQYVYYVKTEKERTWNFSYSGAIAFNLRRVFFSVEKIYSDAKEHWNTEIDIRPRRKEDRWRSSVLFQILTRTSFEFRWTQVKYDYENLLFDVLNVREQLNRKETYFDLSGFYQVTSRTRYFMNLEYGEFRFDFAQTALIRNSSSKAAYMGLEFSPLGRIRGRIRIGYKKSDVLSSEGVDYSGIVGDTQVTVRLAKPFVVRAGYKRDVTFSLWYNNPYFLESLPSAGASFYLLKFVRLDYDYSLGRNRYPVAQNVGPGEDVKRVDDYRIHSAGIYFRLWKKAALGFIASWWMRESNISAANDKRLFYGLNLTYDF